MDVLAEIFLFLDRWDTLEIRLACQEFNQTILQTPFFKRDYMISGSFLNWLHFPEIRVGICQYHLTRYLDKNPDMIPYVFNSACQCDYPDMVDYILGLY